MTEEEWLTCDDPRRMLELVTTQPVSKSRKRAAKFRLFMVACCRRWLCHLVDDRSRTAILVAEAHAAGQTTRGELLSAYQAACAVTRGRRTNGNRVHDRAHFLSVAAYVFATKFSPERTAGQASWFVRVSTDNFLREDYSQSALLRDIFGNPFRPVIVDLSWFTETVLALATGIYAERAFDRMPILADALQDAGCDDTDILTHCRGDWPHVRGCWVVDLILGKS